MKKIVVSFGRTIGMQGHALLPAILKNGQVNVFVILKNAEFEILFHVPLLISRRESGAGTALLCFIYQNNSIL